MLSKKSIIRIGVIIIIFLSITEIGVMKTPFDDETLGIDKQISCGITVHELILWTVSTNDPPTSDPYKTIYWNWTRLPFYINFIVKLPPNDPNEVVNFEKRYLETMDQVACKLSENFESIDSLESQKVATANALNVEPYQVTAIPSPDGVKERYDVTVFDKDGWFLSVTRALPSYN